MNMREVTEFVIVPPHEAQRDITAQKDRFRAYLERHFPGYAFSIAPMAPVDSARSFAILPVMNFIDDENRMRMCEQPSQWLVSEIANACGRFSDFSARLDG